MKQVVLTSKVVQTDDTPVPVLDAELTRTRKGRLWTYVGDRHHPYIVYDYTGNRRAEGPEDFLRSYHGYLQADAYSGYDALFKNRPADLTEVACRVGEDVATLTPHRPGRAEFPHPVPHGRDSLPTMYR